jgi:cation diffusion facilitator CzcD-associated flavoprotein CzcO
VTSSHEVVVIGAGPAGLATGRELARRNIGYVIFERGSRAGHTWDTLYDSLVLHTGKHLSALPGLPFPGSTPLFPSRKDFLDYLHRYVDWFRLAIATGTEVVSATRDRDGWLMRTAGGQDVRARAVVIATGIVANPHLADLPGRERFRGRIDHSVTYRRPEPFRSQRVLVVGVGNSAGEIAAELADAGAFVTIAVRSGARIVPRQLLGIPIQYFAVGLSALPRAAHRGVAEAIARVSELIRGPAVLPRPREDRCSDVPLIGFHLANALRAGKIRLKGAVVELTTDGARFADGSTEPFDRILLATGYRPAVAILGNQIQRDDCGFARRRDRVTSLDQPDLYFVGHNYDTRGALRNIWQDAQLVGKALAQQK